MRARLVILAFSLTTIAGVSHAADQVVNIDFNGNPTGGDTTHVGDDGALSTTGGTFWNGVQVGVSQSNLHDEFDVITPVGVVMSPSSFGSIDAASTNNLQDSGIQAPFSITGLLPGQLYTLVGYVGVNGGFNVTDAGGAVGFQGFGNPTYVLPGVQGNGGDYMRFDNLAPFDLGGGVFGVVINPDGLITGVQISGVVPTPATIVVAAFAGVPALTRRRRSFVSDHRSITSQSPAHRETGEQTP